MSIKLNHSIQYALAYMHTNIPAFWAKIDARETNKFLIKKKMLFSGKYNIDSTFCIHLILGSRLPNMHNL